MTTKNKPIAPARTLALFVAIATLKHRHEIAVATAGREADRLSDEYEPLIEEAELCATSATYLTATSNGQHLGPDEVDDRRERARAQFIYGQVNMNNARKLITKMERLAAKAVRS